MYVTLELEEGGSNIENAEFPSLDARTVTSRSTTDKTMSQPFSAFKTLRWRELPQQSKVRTTGRTPAPSRGFGSFCSCPPEHREALRPVEKHIDTTRCPQFQLLGVCWLPLVHPTDSVLPEPLEPHA